MTKDELRSEIRQEVIRQLEAEGWLNVNWRDYKIFVFYKMMRSNGFNYNEAVHEVTDKFYISKQRAKDIITNQGKAE